MPEIAALWDAYTGGRARSRPEAEAAREALIVHYAPLVRYVAARVRSAVPSHVDAADLASAGVVGLIGAIESYRPEEGTVFESYAVPRIRGAILDDLRRLDWIPRSLRRRAREIDDVTASMAAQRGCWPSPDEVAERLGTTTSDLRDTLSQIAFADVVALTERDDPVHRAPADPLEEIEQWDVHESVVRAVHRLPVRERIVIALYYYEAFTLAQIGEVLGVGESRVSQLHAAAVRRLRPWMLAEAG